MHHIIRVLGNEARSDKKPCRGPRRSGVGTLPLTLNLIIPGYTIC